MHSKPASMFLFCLVSPSIYSVTKYAVMDMYIFLIARVHIAAHSQLK